MALEQVLRDAAQSPYSAAKLPRHVPTIEEAYAVQRNVYTSSNVPVTVWKLGLTGAEGLWCEGTHRWKARRQRHI